ANSYLPLLREVVERSQGTPNEFQNRAIFAMALNRAGLYGEAEPLLRQLLAEPRWDLPSGRPACAEELVQLLAGPGRAEEALRLHDQAQEWRGDDDSGDRLVTEITRLNLLYLCGQKEEVCRYLIEHAARLGAATGEARKRLLLLHCDVA